MKNSKTDIVMFGHKQIPSRAGGVEIVVDELCTGMASKGYNILCYNRKDKNISIQERLRLSDKDYEGVRIKNVFTINKKGLAAVTSSFFAAVKCIFTTAKIVHIHAEGPAFMCWLPKLFGKKVVVTIHGLDWKRDKWKDGFASKYIRKGEEMAVKFADEIIVLSRNVQNYFKEKYDRECSFIPNGVYMPNLYKADIIKKLYSIEKNEYILFLGRLVPEKGVHRLIEAFNKIETSKKLVIAGATSDTDEYVKKLKSLANNDKVIFTGFVEGEILEELFSNAYIYVLPSSLEGMPLSLLEAMSYSNACLVSDIPELTEVVEDKAEVFDVNSDEDLKNKIEKLINNKGLVKKYKSEACDFICKKYNWDEVVEKTLLLYRNLIAKNK